MPTSYQTGSGQAERTRERLPPCFGSRIWGYPHSRRNVRKGKSRGTARGQGHDQRLRNLSLSRKGEVEPNTHCSVRLHSDFVSRSEGRESRRNERVCDDTKVGAMWYHDDRVVLSPRSWTRGNSTGLEGDEARHVSIGSCADCVSPPSQQNCLL